MSEVAFATMIPDVSVAPKLVTIRDFVTSIDSELKAFQISNQLEGIDRTKVSLIHYGITSAIWDALEEVAIPSVDFTVDSLREMLPGSYKLATDEIIRNNLYYIQKHYCYASERVAKQGLGHYMEKIQKGRGKVTIYRFRKASLT